MTRQLRLIIPGLPLHIIQRGNNRSVLFHDAGDFTAAADMLYDATTKHACEIHSYVLMHNHLHLLLTPTDERGPSRMMQLLGLRFVRYFNHRYGRTGTAWEGRFKSAVIQSQQYFFACSRYIELNPVRARIVDEPSAYPWSSFRHNALGTPDRLVTSHQLFRTLGADDRSRRSAYAELFSNHVDRGILEQLRYNSQIGGVIDSAMRASHDAATTTAPTLTPPSLPEL